jgi:hypothetical protein
VALLHPENIYIKLKGIFVSLHISLGYSGHFMLSPSKLMKNPNGGRLRVRLDCDFATITYVLKKYRKL